MSTSYPRRRTRKRRLQFRLPGGVPERPKGTGCKPVGSAYGGSNPPAPIYSSPVRDLGADTAVSGSAGRYSATLHEGWDIWGPQGGYVAGVALRAAGELTSFRRPASFSCHFLRPA